MRNTDWRNNGDGEMVEFDIHCAMKKCWADEFISFLKHMENLGNAGCSRVVAFYADGDGDFRPKFTTNLVDAKITEPTKTLEGGFTLFDAG